MRHGGRLRVILVLGAVAVLATMARYSVAGPSVAALDGAGGSGEMSSPVDRSRGELRPPSGVGVCAGKPSDRGPAEPPVGAVTIPTNREAAAVVADAPSGTTFWFAPGIHEMHRAVETRTGDTFLGAPGAHLIGGPGNGTAFAGRADDVTLRFLDVSDFGAAASARTADASAGTGDANTVAVNTAAVNRSVGDGWRVEQSSFRRLDAAALFLGSGSVVLDSCFDSNGQYGVSVPSRRAEDGTEVAITEVVISGNEFVGNNPNDLESGGACRGCTGAMKLWMPDRATITGNHIHDNHGVGVWVDTNGIDVVVEDNLIEDNDRAGVVLETSYNARIVANTFRGNAVVAGRERGPGATFPDAALYVSESGGAEAVGQMPARVDVHDNVFIDNWNGVTLWENSNRFCSSDDNTSVGRCPLGGADLDTCAAMDPGDLDLLLDACRWRTRRVDVHDNLFRMDDGFDCPAPTCGRNSIIAGPFDPVVRTIDSTGRTRSVTVGVDPEVLQGEIVGSASNTFADNSYEGPWAFSLGRADSRHGRAEWAAAGFDR